MNDGHMQWFPSKVDWWLGLALAVPPVASVVAAFAAYLTEERGEWLLALIPLVIVAVVYVGLVFPMRYGVGSSHLVIRSGLVRQRIPLANVSEVVPTRNPLSSPALSIKRLRVDFGEGFFKSVMISPADREGFLKAIAARTNLKREGERLFRN